MRGDDEYVHSPGDEVAAQERAFWDNRRLVRHLDDDETGRREKRRLSAQGRKMHLRVRMHRYARRWDTGPVSPYIDLQPLPDQEDPGTEVGPHFSCEDVDLLAAALKRAGRTTAAVRLLIRHADGPEEGDGTLHCHWPLPISSDSCPTDPSPTHPVWDYLDNLQ